MTSRTRCRTIRLWLAAAGATLALCAASAPAADSTALIRKARKEVVEASIKAPTDPKAGSPDLRRAVDTVDGIRLEPKAEPVPPMPDIPPMPAIAPMPIVPLKPATENSAPNGPAISDAVIEKLKTLPPDKVADPLGLADTLYMGGRLAEACTFYEKAFAGAAGPDTKAWVLYQMANCRRSSDPAAAVALYKRVTTEFPKSQWAGVSGVQQRLLEWYQTVGPVKSPETKKPATGSAAVPEAQKPASESAAVPEARKLTTESPAAPGANKLSSGH